MVKTHVCFRDELDHLELNSADVDEDFQFKCAYCRASVSRDGEPFVAMEILEDTFVLHARCASIAGERLIGDAREAHLGSGSANMIAHISRILYRACSNEAQK